MSNLLNDFDWKDYGMKHGLDSDSKCVEHAIRASVVVDDSKKALYLTGNDILSFHIGSVSQQYSIDKYIFTKIVSILHKYN